MPADIIFSMHSLLKIEILKAHSIAVTKELVEDVVRSSARIDKGYKERLVAQKGFDQEVTI